MNCYCVPYCFVFKLYLPRRTSYNSYMVSLIQNGINFIDVKSLLDVYRGGLLKNVSVHSAFKAYSVLYEMILPPMYCSPLFLSIDS